MIIDVRRAITARKSPEAIVDMLLNIPEVGRAADAPLDPARILTAAADWLDDGFHDRLAAELREIAAGGELEPWPPA
jgi:hypothetical protein